MTHNSARSLLVALYGQLISVYKADMHGRTMCRVCELFLSSNYGYEERLIWESETWEGLIRDIKPEALNHYDSQFDFFEPVYINRLSIERKSRVAEQRNSRPNLLQSDNPP